MPGAAYLQRRLARAQAVPPAERSPDVQAFITSVQLGEEACQLLPLTRGGQAALPLRNPATARRQAGFGTRLQHCLLRAVLLKFSTTCAAC